VEAMAKAENKLPVLDKSDIGGSALRDENSRPDPTAAYALTQSKRLPLDQSSTRTGPPATETKAPAAPPAAEQSSVKAGPPSAHPASPPLPPVCWSGTFFEPGDWAENSRYLLEAAHQNLDIYLQITGQEDSSLPLTEEGVNLIRRLAGRGAPGPENYIRLWDMPPSQIRELDATARWNVAKLDWPTDRLPEDWQEKCRSFDQIWVPSHHHRKILTDSGIPTGRIRLLPAAVDTEVFSPDREIQPLPLDCLDKYNFLAVFDWDDLCAWKLLLKTYLTTFEPDEAVNLILKPDLPTGLTATDIQTDIISYLTGEGIDLIKSPSIVFLAHRLPPQEMTMLYRAADAFVMPCYGGNASPHYLEAMAMVLPIIATRWGAHLDYLNDSNAFLVNVERFQKVDLPAYLGHRWALPSEAHLKENLRQLFSDPGAAKAIGRRARETAVEELDARLAINRMIENLRELSAVEV